MKIDGSVALVTGANRGLGRAVARELVSRGRGPGRDGDQLRRHAEHASIVDQQFDRAELSLDAPDDLRCTLLVGDICREAQGAAASDLDQSSRLAQFLL
jgi:NAD(P)-dependent dehydrogenase (short-subunit alcohol dehydrogenase family)